MGATPLEELYIMYRRAWQLLRDLGVEVHRPYVGEFATSLEMAGASISVLRLEDDGPSAASSAEEKQSA